METNTDLIAAPFGLDDRRDILAEILLQGESSKKFCGGMLWRIGGDRYTSRAGRTP
jgi:hypothetical protein